MFIIGDIHGAFKTLVALHSRLRIIDKNCDIYTVGDLIDRGPSSPQVVDYVMNANMKPVLGNHEQMLLLYKRPDNFEKLLSQIPRYRAMANYMRNGGEITLDTYENNMELFNKHLDYFESLPLYYLIEKFGKKILITHAGLEENKFLFNDLFRAWLSYLWNRTSNFSDEYFQVFGHTPHSKVAIYKNKKGKYAINIDTGCGIKNFLSAIHLREDGYNIIRQQYID